MRATSSPDSKRMKTVHSLTDLPSDQLAAIADYLPKLSRAMFAVALTAQPKSFRVKGWKGKPSYASNAVVSSAGSQYWEELDFSETHIKKEFFGKLSDDDIGAMLLCVNAKNTMKKLVLPHYRHSIVGYGLKPLRRSIVLEEIDLGNRYCWNSKQPLTQLSVSTIVHILDSIVDARGNKLHKISIPSQWTAGELRNKTPLCEFYEKINEFLMSKDIPCSHCSTLCGVREDENRQCQCCFKRLCTQCIHNQMIDEDAWNMQERHFALSCGHCSKVLCGHCGNHRVCDSCESIYCNLCSRLDDVDAAVWCESDDCTKESTCMACRVPEEQDGCWGCQSLVFPKIMIENTRLTDENKELLDQIEELREKLSLGNDCE